jgi:hypothetical protein
MTIAPFILLIVYLVGIAVFLTLSILSVYHILRFGFSTKLGTTITIIYAGLIIIVILVTFQMLSGVEWKEPLEISLPFISSTDAGFE